jgi:hypothetical protein
MSNKVDVYIYPTFDLLVVEDIPEMIFKRQWMVGVNPHTKEITSESIELPISPIPVTKLREMGDPLHIPEFQNYFDGPKDFILHYSVEDAELVMGLKQSRTPRGLGNGPRIVAPSAGDVAAVNFSKKPWECD